MKNLSTLATSLWIAALGWMPLPLQAQVNLDPSSFTSVDIGAPLRAGSTTSVPGGYAISGGGTNVVGTSDQFQFNYQSFTGDFDVSVRLESLSFTEAWTKAGLMARETLLPSSRYAASFATPSASGAFFQWRLLTSGDTTNRGNFPVTYPNLWLRLKRTGNSFTGYAGADGKTWVVLGTTGLTLTNGAPISVGLAVVSQNASQLATAQFRSLDNVTGTPPVISMPLFSREPIGASSRRTELTISEIMYHPRVPAGVSGSLEFIEIYNSQAFDENIGGYRISGSVDYTFPANTVIRSGQFLVVARDPSAMQGYYKISGVIGPWEGSSTNSLPGGSGTVRLRNRQGGVMLQVNYLGRNPWPIAADGAGHSLVLTRPTYGEGDPRAWSASDAIDGSPGRDEPYGSDPLRTVVINEVLAHTEPSLGVEDYVELYNRSTQPVDLSGAYLTDEAGTNKFQVPNGTTLGAGEFLAYNESTLGFALSAGGERLFLVNSNQTRVIDALDFDAQANGVSLGRFPDGGPSFYEMAARTPGEPNGIYLRRPVVINELMYAPISGNNDDEYIELYNRTASPVNLGGWKFTSGVNYTFPSNTFIPANGYLVVAKSQTNLLAHYAQLNSQNTVGDYGGSLANSGERVALSRPDLWVTVDTNGLPVTNTIFVVENEVTYQDGGRWGVWADGGGSSLELVDPNSDTRQPANWADSDETGKGEWTSYEFVGPLGETLSTPVGDNLALILLGIGECLVDEVEVRGTNGLNLVTNPGFESGMTGWTPQGSHDFSVIEDSGFAGTKSLRVRAASRGDNGPNRVRGPVLTPAVITGQVTIRAKVKWIKGWPEILFRTHGGGAEAIGRMKVPVNLGTPGQANSRRIPNAGPAVYNVSHSPILPQAGDPVVVTCTPNDPDGIGTMTLRYRVDNGATSVSPGMFSSMTMVDNGTGGDAIAGDGIYSATLPAQPANTVVAFYVQAVDSLGAANLFPQYVFPPPGYPRCFPNDAIARECVVRWGDVVMPGSFATYHLWLTYANSNRWGTRVTGLDNAQLDGTFVYNSCRAVYNSLPLYAGSPWHRLAMTGGPAGTYRVDFVQNFPTDDRMLGNTDFVLNNPGNPDAPGPNTSDTSAQAEQASYIIFKEIGLVYNHRRYVHHFVNGNQRSTTGNRPGNFIFEDSQQPNGDMIEEWFPDDTDGNLYKIEDWFEFPDNGFDFTSNNDADLTRRTINKGGTNALTIAPYRFMFRARSVGSGGSANDYDPLFRAIDALSPSPLYSPSGSSNNQPVPDPAAFEAVVDVEQWLRVFAVQHTIGNWDSYGYERGKNDYTYKPNNGRFAQMTWDIDFTMGVGGHGATQTIWDSNDPRVYGIMNTPVFMRYLWRGFYDIINGPFRNAFMDPILDAKYNALRANGVNVDNGVVGTIKSFITGRRNFLSNELARVSPPFSVAFATDSFSTANNLLVVRGGAPVVVADITVSINGGPAVKYPLTWSGSGTMLPNSSPGLQYSVTNFTFRLVLQPGVNSIVIQGIDRLGQAVANASRTLTVTYDGVVPDPAGALVFNELMYNPLVPGAGFVELLNRSDAVFGRSDASFDLSGYRINGLDYTFPFGSIITNHQFLVLVKNRAAFASVYTNNPVVPFGQFDGNLDTDGETLTLLKPGAPAQGGPSPDVVIDRVRYEARLPWGTNAATGGVSLQLIDAAQDNSRPSNWAVKEEWRYVSYTANATGLRDTNFLMWLSVAGDVYVDDVVLVTGTVARVGQNLLVNGDFEAPLAGTWEAFGNHTNSVQSTEFSHSGSSSLHILSTGLGGPSSSVRQDILPFPTNTPCTVSFYFRPNTNSGQLQVRLRTGSSFASINNLRFVTSTPGEGNTSVSELPPYDPLWLNEVQPDNVAGPTDNFSQRDPWIELYNAGDSPLDLSPYYLADNYDVNLQQWQFPAGSSIGPKEFKIIWADGQPQQTAGNNLHTSFRLNSSTGVVALVRMVGNAPQITDYLTYSQVPSGQSYGDYPDGQPFFRQLLVDATPGGTNVARFVDVFINEWMAANTNSLADPADGQFNDWFELYNAGSSPVDLGGFFLTDKPGNSADFFQVPTNGNYVIPAGGFLLVWADNTIAQNSPTFADLHVPFELSRNGDSIALFAPDKQTLIDRVDFNEQVDDVSQGRFPDGDLNIYPLAVASPRGPNVLGSGNTPPQLAPIQSRTIRLGQTVSFTAVGTDADTPQQTLTYTLLAGAPSGAQINSSSGLFTWTPTILQAPSINNMTVRVTDNGVPPLSTTRNFAVIVLLPPTAGITSGPAGQVTLQFDTIPGRTYKVQFKNNLNDAVWQDLTAPQVAGGTSMSATDSLAASPQRFYRIVQLD